MGIETLCTMMPLCAAPIYLPRSAVVDISAITPLFNAYVPPEPELWLSVSFEIAVGKDRDIIYLEASKNKKSWIRRLGRQANVCCDVNDERDEICRTATHNVGKVSIEGWSQALENQERSHGEIHQ